MGTDEKQTYPGFIREIRGQWIKEFLKSGSARSEISVH
jgi:hypothetical protein